MIYTFICPSCNKKETIENPMSAPMPKIYCSCGTEMKQDLVSKFKTLSLHTPESFKAGSEYAPKDFTDGNQSTDLGRLPNC